MLTELNVIDIEQSFAQDFIGTNYNDIGHENKQISGSDVYSLPCTAK